MMFKYNSFAFLISIVFLILSIAACNNSTNNMELVRVVDGDTIYANYKGSLHKIRLMEVDAPEPDQPYGNESTLFLRELLNKDFVGVEIFGKDRFGRDLARLYLDGQDINRLMVRNGFAWVYEEFVTDTSFYKDQDIAQLNGLGLWSSEDSIPPWDWRKGKKIEKVDKKPCCRICVKGKACGDGCINSNYTCRTSSGCACNG